MYWQDLWFMCPRRDFENNLYRLRLGAESWGLKTEVLYTNEFRNPQRLWARAKEATVRISGPNKDKLTAFVDGIHF
ncbi:MAG: hypothetical protein WAU03_01970 [Candidatus Saccharimonas aalborgensis]